MRILLSVENFYPRLGGGEVFVDELMTELSKKGHDVYVIYAGERKLKSDLKLLPQKKSFVFKNIPLFNRTVIRQYFANLRWGVLLDKKIKEIRPDLILTQLEYVPSTVDVSKKNGVPVVVFIQNYDHFCADIFRHCSPEECTRDCFKCSSLIYKIQYPISKIYLKWHEEALKKADFVFSDSKYAADILYKFYKVKSKVLNPVLHLDEFTIKDKKEGKYITFINPIKTKGAEITLEIAKKMPEHEFMVIGGKDRDFITEFKKTKNVNYISWTEDMKEVYKKTRILLVPSLWPEPFGRVISEAQINGIPCITSNSGGIPEAVGEGGIIIKEAFDIENWIEAIKSLDETSEYNQIEKYARKNAQKREFKKQWKIFEKELHKLVKYKLKKENNERSKIQS